MTGCSCSSRAIALSSFRLALSVRGRALTPLHRRLENAGDCITAFRQMRSGCLGLRLRFELADMPAQLLVEEIDDDADSGRAAHALMGHEPHHPAVAAPRRDALDEVRIDVRHDA